MINFLRPGWAMMILTMILPLMACGPAQSKNKNAEQANSEGQKHQRLEALIILDFQNDFFGQNAKLPVDSAQGVRAIATVQALLSSIDTSATRVVYIGNEFPKSDRIANWFRNGAAIQGTSGAELLTEIPNDLGPYFSKQEGDAFSNAQLGAWLQQQNISRITIAGVFADQCVMATARGALKNGYSVAVYQNGVAASNEKNLQKAYKRFADLGIEILESP